MRNIGGFGSFQIFPIRSHTWKDGMDLNMLKASTLLHPSVKSRSTPLPASGADLDCYVDPASGNLCVWFDGDWNAIAPRRGVWVHVEDTNSYDTYDPTNGGWVTVIELGKTYPALPRTMGVYVPGKIRPSATVFDYVAGMEFVLPAGAPGSTATLEIPPTAQIAFTMPGGRIVFAAGATTGAFEVPEDVYVQPTQQEGMFTRAQRFRITSPANLHDAEGLAITFSGMMRGMS